MRPTPKRLTGFLLLSVLLVGCKPAEPPLPTSAIPTLDQSLDAVVAAMSKAQGATYQRQSAGSMSKSDGGCRYVSGTLSTPSKEGQTPQQIVDWFQQAAREGLSKDVNISTEMPGKGGWYVVTATDDRGVTVRMDHKDETRISLDTLVDANPCDDAAPAPNAYDRLMSELQEKLRADIPESSNWKRTSSADDDVLTADMPVDSETPGRVLAAINPVLRRHGFAEIIGFVDRKGTGVLTTTTTGPQGAVLELELRERIEFRIKR